MDIQLKLNPEQQITLEKLQELMIVILNITFFKIN